MQCMDITEKTAILRKFSIFGSLSDQAFLDVGSKTHEIAIDEGKVFIRQGDTVGPIYFIYNGLAKIYRLNENGMVANLGFAGEFEIVGDMAFITSQNRSASVEAMRKVDALVLSPEDFKNILYAYPEISIQLMQIFSQRLRKSNASSEEMMFQNLTHRTWIALETLSKYFPEKSITLSHEELAEIVGATRARTTEALHQLQKEKKIQLSHRNIHIL